MANESESVDDSPASHGRVWGGHVEGAVAGNESAQTVNAADAMAKARANIAFRGFDTPEPNPEAQPPALDSQPSTPGSWPITRPNIPGAEPNESPLMTVFRQARTEIGGWGTRAHRERLEQGALDQAEPDTPELHAQALLTGPRRSVNRTPMRGFTHPSDPGGGRVDGAGVGRVREDGVRETAPTPEPDLLPVPRGITWNPRPSECTCALYCFDLEATNESQEQCTMELWCDAVAPADTRYKFTSLRGVLELYGAGDDVPWEIRTSGQQPAKYIMLSAVNARRISELKGELKPWLDGTDPCAEGTRVVFGIVPTQVAIQKLIDGDMAPVSEDVIALINNEECAHFTVTLQVKPCDTKRLSEKAATLNENAPGAVCFTFANTLNPVKSASELPGSPGAEAALAITVDVQLAISTSTLFECPDCCCEYYDHSFMWITVTAQWVSGTKGAARLAAIKQAELRSRFESMETLEGLTALLKKPYPKCFLSRACPSPLPAIFSYTFSTDYYSLQEVLRHRQMSNKSEDEAVYCEDMRVQAAKMQREALGSSDVAGRFFKVDYSDNNPPTPENRAEGVSTTLKQKLRAEGHRDLALRIPEFLHAGLIVQRKVNVTWHVLDFASEDYDCVYVIASAISIDIGGTTIWASNAEDEKDRLRGRLVRNELLELWGDYRAKLVDVPEYQSKILMEVLRGLPHQCKSRDEADKFIKSREQYFKEMPDPRLEIRTDDSPTHAATPFYSIALDQPQPFGRPDVAPLETANAKSIDLRLKKFIGGTTYTVPGLMGGLEQVFVPESFTFCSPIGRQSSRRLKEDRTIPKNFGDLGTMLRELLSSGQKLRFLTIEAHGNGTVINLSAKAAPPTFGEADNIDPKLFIQENPKFLREMVWEAPKTGLSSFLAYTEYAVELMGVVLAPCFAANAEVYLNVCAIGVRQFAQFFADATNTTVYAPAGCIAQGTNFDSVLSDPKKYIMLRPYPHEPIWPEAKRELLVFRRHQPFEVWKP